MKNLLDLTIAEYAALPEAEKAEWKRQWRAWMAGGADWDKGDEHELGALNEVTHSGEKCE